MTKKFTSSIIKKSIITISLLAVLAVGTIISGYATAYNLGSKSNFVVEKNGFSIFESGNAVVGSLVDQTTSYCTIYNNASYSQGAATVRMTNTGKTFSTSYYIQKNNAAPTVISYGTVPKGSNTHTYKYTRSGGFKTSTLQLYQYT